LTRIYAIRTMIFAAVLAMFMAACHSDNGSPRDVLNRYFTAAIKQDYAAQYSCYYNAYKAKVSKDDFIRHRADASVLMSYLVDSVDMAKDRAHARVLLKFAPSEKLKRDQPVEKTVIEDLVREDGEWRIKVW
jgi:hypothetical protein